MSASVKSHAISRSATVRGDKKNSTWTDEWFSIFVCFCFFRVLSCLFILVLLKPAWDASLAGTGIYVVQFGVGIGIGIERTTWLM
jgi:hypothetical protein